MWLGNPSTGATFPCRLNHGAEEYPLLCLQGWAAASIREPTKGRYENGEARRGDCGSRSGEFTWICIARFAGSLSATASMTRVAGAKATLGETRIARRPPAPSGDVASSASAVMIRRASLAECGFICSCIPLDQPLHRGARPSSRQHARSVHAIAKKLAAPEPRPGVRSYEHVDLVRRDLEASEIQIRDRLDRIERKPDP